jgi:rhamnogalacturonan endolyase
MRLMRIFCLVVGVALMTLTACAGVTLTDDNATYTLANEHITAKVSKRSGDLMSLRYKDLELMGGGSGHPAGYWSHAPTAARPISSITIDPKINGGTRAEISVKGISGGARQGQGPGGSVIADIEIRYALGADDHGLYTYSIFTHPPDYPATSVGEARFGVKLNAEVFDWMTIDANRNKKMPTPADWDKGTPLNMKEARRMTTGLYAGQAEHKYDYSAVQFDIPAFGWSSATKHVGLWFVNPTIEYLSGGATKVELTGHLDVNTGAAPTLLNYWRGSHYGGSRCDIAQGESWTKVIGPFLIYCNSGGDPTELWHDALAQAKKETATWPYDWVGGVDYPHKEKRGIVMGRLVLDDPQAADTKMTNVLVGLAAPDYAAAGGRRGGGPATVDWQQDAKYYQFWARADDQGRFNMPAVRPGSYTLHAIATGVLGEYAETNVIVQSGKQLDLGQVKWKPVRHGHQLWEIGIPNRTAEEFRHGDHYWQWGLYNEYPTDFPNDVNFFIGKSDYRTDWNYCQCPRADRPNGTPWSVTFDLPVAPKGKATLRLAFAATSARSIQVVVNDQVAGTTGPLIDTASIRRDGIRGYWYERDIAFDAALLKSGTNVLKLIIPPGGVMSGVEYDYVRLELDEAAKAPVAP